MGLGGIVQKAKGAWLRAFTFGDGLFGSGGGKGGVDGGNVADGFGESSAPGVESGWEGIWFWLLVCWAVFVVLCLVGVLWYAGVFDSEGESVLVDFRLHDAPLEEDSAASAAARSRPVRPDSLRIALRAMTQPFLQLFRGLGSGPLSGSSPRTEFAVRVRGADAWLPAPEYLLLGVSSTHGRGAHALRHTLALLRNFRTRLWFGGKDEEEEVEEEEEAARDGGVGEEGGDGVEGGELALEGEGLGFGMFSFVFPWLIEMATRRDNPLPVLGSVLRSLSIEVPSVQALGEAEESLVKLQTVGASAHRRGTQIETECVSTTTGSMQLPLWRARVGSVLFHAPLPHAEPLPPPRPWHAAAARSHLFGPIGGEGEGGGGGGGVVVVEFDVELEEDLGLQFAAINGDYNPIHWSPMLATLFGQKSTIAHGTSVVETLFPAALGLAHTIARIPPTTEEEGGGGGGGGEEEEEEERGAVQGFHVARPDVCPASSARELGVAAFVSGSLGNASSVALHAEFRKPAPLGSTVHVSLFNVPPSNEESERQSARERGAGSAEEDDNIQTHVAFLVTPSTTATALPSDALLWGSLHTTFKRPSKTSEKKKKKIKVASPKGDVM